jgi:hypothetical protein
MQTQYFRHIVHLVATLVLGMNGLQVGLDMTAHSVSFFMNGFKSFINLAQNFCVLIVT